MLFCLGHPACQQALRWDDHICYHLRIVHLVSCSPWSAALLTACTWWCALPASLPRQATAAARQAHQQQQHCPRAQQQQHRSQAPQTPLCSPFLLLSLLPATGSLVAPAVYQQHHCRHLSQGPISRQQGHLAAAAAQQQAAYQVRLHLPLGRKQQQQQQRVLLQFPRQCSLVQAVAAAVAQRQQVLARRLALRLPFLRQLALQGLLCLTHTCT
jgi:hypothetical protein